MIYTDLVLERGYSSRATKDTVHLGVWASPNTHAERGTLYREAHQVLAEFVATIPENATLPSIIADASAFLRQKGWSEVPFQMVRAVVQIPAKADRCS